MKAIKEVAALSIGTNIQKYRQRLGLSQQALGQKLNVSEQTVRLWEEDKAVPTIENLKQLKDAFQISVDAILAGQDDAKTNINENSLDTVCAALAYAMGIQPPQHAAPKNGALAAYVDEVFGGEKADRIVMYNPDAIAQWIYEKYPGFFQEIRQDVEARIPLAAVMPSVTPVCFGTMYTGAQPQVHGIRRYEKPVITIDTLFDALIRAGKKPALVTYGGSSLGKIYQKRNMDYFHFETKDRWEESSLPAVNAKVMELILQDDHDFIVVYNGNYDSVMHKFGPESPEALAELRLNCHIFSCISEQVKAHWQHHNALLGFAMDHGCHEIDGGCGSHGLDMAEDINIVHLYKGYAKRK